jgi:hypothetical protein
MRTDTSAALTAWRRLVLACVGALGVIGIVGSGGGGDSSANCSFFSNVCDFTGFTVPPFPTFPFATVRPGALTVQVGDTAVFTAGWSGIDQPSFQWSRSSDGGRSYVDIAGANSPTYTLAGAQLTDDATVFRVRVGNPGLAAGAVLTVSSMPGVVVQDGNFQPSDWVTAAAADPAQGGSTHSTERLVAGGHPDAYRRMVHTMSPGPSGLSVFHLYQAAPYDPPTQGPIYVIDYTDDCIVPNSAATSHYITSNLLVEQGGRKYVPADGLRTCASATWVTAQPLRASLRAADFALVDGPGCGAGESCPDFSGQAAPLHFGYVRRTELVDGKPADSVEHGIDNWKVTVWRR